MRQSSRDGFSMVEVTLALGVAGFCLAALLGLIPLGSSQNADASKATASTGLASAILADVRAADPAAAQTTVYHVALPTTLNPNSATTFFLTDAGEYLSSASAMTPSGKTARYQAMIQIVAPSSAQPQQSTAVDLRIWEPAVVAPAQAAGVMEIATCVTR